jgi:hypothetical protein
LRENNGVAQLLFLNVRGRVPDKEQTKTKAVTGPFNIYWLRLFLM